MIYVLSLFFLTSLDLSNFNTNKVKDKIYILFDCSSLKSLNLSNFSANNVNMSYMINSCSSLIFLNLSNNVKDMSNLFSICRSLTSLGLSNFNSNNVTNMSVMFFGIKKICNLICDGENNVR